MVSDISPFHNLILNHLTYKDYVWCGFSDKFIGRSLEIDRPQAILHMVTTGVDGLFKVPQLINGYVIDDCGWYGQEVITSNPTKTRNNVKRQKKKSKKNNSGDLRAVARNIINSDYSNKMEARANALTFKATPNYRKMKNSSDSVVRKALNIIDSYSALKKSTDPYSSGDEFLGIMARESHYYSSEDENRCPECFSTDGCSEFCQIANASTCFCSKCGKEIPSSDFDHILSCKGKEKVATRKVTYQPGMTPCRGCNQPEMCCTCNDLRGSDNEWGEADY